MEFMLRFWGEVRLRRSLTHLPPEGTMHARTFLLLASAWVAQLSAQDFTVTPPPEETVRRLQLDPFYKKHVSVSGFSIVSSEKVPDAALLEAAWIVRHELEGRDDILRAMSANRVRLAIMAHDEFTTQVPEHRTMTPGKYWDKRARGLGATAERPAVSCGAENLLCYPGDPYHEENILVHEFAHAIHQMGLSSVDPTFDQRLQDAYKAALAEGLWKNTYAATNRSEYWAEVTQSWFDTNRANDNQHNDISTREKLKAYDPRVARLLTEVYGDGSWRYQRPQNREPEDRSHLTGWDLAQAPHFVWPKELLDWNANSLRRSMVSTEEYADVPLAPLPETGGTKSHIGGGKSSLHFFNQRSTEVHLQWMDPQGVTHDYGVIAPGGDQLQQTYAGHAWLITEGQNQPLGEAVALDRPGKVVIN